MIVARLVTPLCIAAIVAAAAGQGAPASAAERIGIASAVQRDVTGRLAGSVRNLNPGNGVFRRERINTQARSSAQLLFLDETSLSIGPSSEVVLDRFVYNPGGTAREVSVEAVKGAFRFVSGSSQSQSYTIRTPLATIGVRGTIVDMLLSASRAIVILVEGAADVCVGAVCTGLVKPGKYIVVNADGRMQGPRTWDNSIRHAWSRVSFPLFGNRLDADRTRRFGITDRRSSVDEIERRAQSRNDSGDHHPVHPLPTPPSLDTPRQPKTPDSPVDDRYDVYTSLETSDADALRSSGNRRSGFRARRRR